MAAILNFRIFAKNGKTQIFKFLPKIEKQKFASISLTVQDRAISSKFSTQPMQKGMKLKYRYMYTNKYLSIIDIFYK